MEPISSLLPQALPQRTNGAHLPQQQPLAETKQRNYLPTITSTPVKTKRSEPECPTCKGLGYTQIIAAKGYQEKQYIEPCNACTDFTKRNGLMPQEQNLKISAMLDLADKSGSINVLRIAAENIINGNGAMFATVFGDTGSAKSLWAKIIVASLCRNGVQALYTRGHAVEQSLFTDEDGVAKNEIQRPTLDWLARVRALVIDEAHAINWKNHWIGNGLQELLDMRYERATSEIPKLRQLTIFVCQHDPQGWAPDYLYDRMRQGEFAIPWDGDTPECLRSRPCPACGGTMRHNGEYLLCGRIENGQLVDGCGHDRDVEIFWPFKDLAKSARPIMPSRKFDGWG